MSVTRSRPAAPDAAPLRRCRDFRTGFATGATAAVAIVLGLAPASARADAAPVTMSGVPQQVIPVYPEPGAPSFSVAPGQPTTGSAGSTGGSSGADGGSALDTMLTQSWGDTAASNATALGVNPSALAATCVIESGCQNVAGSGSVAGAFQMTAPTYSASLTAALAQDPGLATGITQGLAGQMDPATESIAAAEYLYQGAQSLQSAGIDNPTVLDVRGYYNFGPANGAALAQADASATMASVMPGVSAATLAANGIAAGETVGQWRAGVAAKIGNAAGQPVLVG